MKIEIRNAVNGVVLRIDRDSLEEHPEEIVYQKSGDAEVEAFADFRVFYSRSMDPRVADTRRSGSTSSSNRAINTRALRKNSNREPSVAVGAVTGSLNSACPMERGDSKCLPPSFSRP